MEFQQVKLSNDVTVPTVTSLAEIQNVLIGYDFNPQPSNDIYTVFIFENKFFFKKGQF